MSDEKTFTTVFGGVNYYSHAAGRRTAWIGEVGAACQSVGAADEFVDLVGRVCNVTSDGRTPKAESLDIHVMPTMQMCEQTGNVKMVSRGKTVRGLSLDSVIQHQTDCLKGLITLTNP